MNKKNVLTAAGIGLAGLAAPSAQADNPLNLPNIVFIMADDLGYGDLACYGSTIKRTPRLDQMADEGMRFTDFYMPGAVCSPSRAGLMTGSYPRRVSLDAVIFPDSSVGLNTNETTIAEILKARGYATMIIGKWHLGDQPSFMPNVHGFDTYFGLPSSNDHYTGRDGRNYNPMPLMLNGSVVETEPDQALLTSRYTQEAISFIEANTNTPFFLFLSHEYPHTPLFPSHQFMTNTTKGAYTAEIEQLDYETGVILDRLDALGLGTNTLVIFTSDNGAVSSGNNSPLRGDKGDAWEGGMREPCIMRWPGTIPSNSVSSALCAAMDMLPTFTAMSGGTLPTNTIDGHDISDIMTGASTNSHYSAFYYYGIDKYLYAVRSGKWKLFLRIGEEYNSTLVDALYDLSTDIDESNNVYSSNPTVVSNLTALADLIIADIGGDTTSDGPNVRPAGYVANPVPLTSRDQSNLCD